MKAVPKVALVTSAVEWSPIISAAGGLMTVMVVPATLIEVCSKWKKIYLLEENWNKVQNTLRVRFFTKILKRIIDPKNPQRMWFFRSYPKGGCFGYMIRSVFILRIRKEWVTRNIFNTYIGCSTTLLVFKAIFEAEAWINRFYSFYRDGKIANTNRTCIALVHKDKTAVHNFVGTYASCKTLHFQYISSCKGRVFICPV